MTLDTNSTPVGRTVAGDVDSPDSSRGRRGARLVRAAALGVAVRVVGVFTQVLSLGVAVRYLGGERYGMWATISTLLAWFSLANLGLGQGLMTRLSGAMGREDEAAARRHVNGALAIILVSSGMLLLAVTAIGLWVPWARLFNVTGVQAMSEATPVVMVASVLTTLCLPLSVSSAVLIGHQRTDLVNLLTLAGSIVGLVALVVAVYFKASMPVLAAALLAGPVFAGVAQCAWGVRAGWIGLDWGSVDWADARSLLGLGFRFLLMQVSGIVVFEAGAVIIAQRFGAAEVTPYAVTTRMVMIIISFFMAVLGPLWPAYGEAFNRGDLEWVRRTFRRSLVFVAVAWVPMAAVLSVVGRDLIRLWAGPEATPDRRLLTAMLLFTLAQALGLVVSYFLNGVGRLKSQLIGGAVMAILHVPLVLLLAGVMGVASVAVSQTILMFAVALPLAFAEVFRVLREAGGGGGGGVTVARAGLVGRGAA